VLEVAVAKLLHDHFRRQQKEEEERGSSSRERSSGCFLPSTQQQQGKSDNDNRKRRPDPRKLQIVAMSATAAKLHRLASWIGGDASLFITDVRPVPLCEFVADASTGGVFRKLTMGSRGVGVEPAPCRVLQEPRPRKGTGEVLPAAARRGDGLALTALVAEAVAAGEPTLIFCGSRAKAEGAARMLSLALPLLLPSSSSPLTSLEQQQQQQQQQQEPSSTPCSSSSSPAAFLSEAAVKRQAKLQQRLRAAAVDRLRELTLGSGNPLLERSILAGVAWHHAGLSAAERAAVESAFKEGAVLALCATSTLAAGVNLPAVRVIVRSLRQAGGGGGPQGGSLLSRAQYLQMAGRAGRAGMASRGEAFLLIGPEERGDAAALLSAPLPPVESRLVLASSLAALRGREKKKEEEQVLNGAAAATAAAAAALAPSQQQQQAPKGSSDEEDPLERLLLEAVACGAVRSSEDAVALVECTLARAQEEEKEADREEAEDDGDGGDGDGKGKSKASSSSSSSSAVAAAAFDALRRLRERRLVSLRTGAAAKVVVKEEEEDEAEKEGGGGACGRENNPPPLPPQEKQAPFLPPPPPPPPLLALFSPTTRGSAVAAACLPTSEGERMHDELEQLFSNPLPLDSLIPLIFGVLPSGSGNGNGNGNSCRSSSFPAFSVRNWAAWERCLAHRLSGRSLRAAKALGVTREHAAGRARLGVSSSFSASASTSTSSSISFTSSSTSTSASSSSLDERHHRFVAAAVAAALLDEESPESVSAKWESVAVSTLGVDAAVAAAAEAAGLSANASSASAAAAAAAAIPSTSAPPLMAIPLGEFQRLQAEVSQRAALGSALAAAAGWEHGASLLASISDRAAASGVGGIGDGAGGARPELLPLLSALPPPILDVRAARALFDAGITDLGKVARAAEERLAKAFLSRVRVPKPKPQQQNTSNTSNNKRPLNSNPGAAWSRWATKAAKKAKEAAQKRMRQEERAREELARAAEAEGGLLQLGTQATTLR